MAGMDISPICIKRLFEGAVKASDGHLTHVSWKLVVPHWSTVQESAPSSLCPDRWQAQIIVLAGGPNSCLTVCLDGGRNGHWCVIYANFVQ